MTTTLGDVSSASSSQHPLHLLQILLFIANASAVGPSFDAIRGGFDLSVGDSGFVSPTMAKDSSPSESASLQDASQDTSK